MKKVLIVVDMQNDFVSGSLANPAAEAIIPKIAEKIKSYMSNEDKVIFTRDTHTANYLSTPEGQKLPVKHCINGTNGWLVVDELNHPECTHINKPTFGYPYWGSCEELWDADVVELVGTCTSICVLSNAVIIKTLYPNIDVLVDANCCACVTPESHKAALLAMKMCQINVYNDEV